MSCFHPVYLAGDPEVDKVTGEVKIRNHVIADNYACFLASQRDFHVQGRRYYPVPCGKCFGCKLDRARSWSVRNMMESSLYDRPSYYLTLTYSDENIHRADYVFNPTIGEVVENASILDKSDLSSFMKNLRQSLRDKGIQDEGVRFFACGEYGPSTFRSHYHVLLYNCILPDLRPLTLSESGIAPPWCLTSDIVLRAWKDRGFVSISEFNYARAAYVSRYVVKKQVAYINDELIDYEVDFLRDTQFPGLERLPKEFVLMSRDPGIGRDWLSTHSDEREFIADGRRFQIPSTVLKFMGAEAAQEIREARRDRAMAITNLKLARSSKTLEQILESEEAVRMDDYFRSHVRPL